MRDRAANDRLGPIAALGLSTPADALELAATREFSDETAHVVDLEVERLLGEQRDRARQVLGHLAALKPWHGLDRAENLSGDEVARIIDEHSGTRPLRNAHAVPAAGARALCERTRCFAGGARARLLRRHVEPDARPVAGGPSPLPTSRLHEVHLPYEEQGSLAGDDHAADDGGRVRRGRRCPRWCVAGDAPVERMPLLQGARGRMSSSRRRTRAARPKPSTGSMSPPTWMSTTKGRAVVTFTDLVAAGGGCPYGDPQLHGISGEPRLFVDGVTAAGTTITTSSYRRSRVASST